MTCCHTRRRLPRLVYLGLKVYEEPRRGLVGLRVPEVALRFVPVDDRVELRDFKLNPPCRLTTDPQPRVSHAQHVDPVVRTCRLRALELDLSRNRLVVCASRMERARGPCSGAYAVGLERRPDLARRDGPPVAPVDRVVVALVRRSALGEVAPEPHLRSADSAP